MSSAPTGSRFKSDIFGANLQCVYHPQLTTFLTNADNRKDLNIVTDSPAWTMCSSAVYTYDVVSMNSSAEWVALRDAGQYRLLMYSGNKDMTVPTIGSEMWLNSLNMTT